MGMSNVWWACDTIRQFSNDQRRCAALSRSTQTRSRCRRADPSLSLSPLSVSLSLFPIFVSRFLSLTVGEESCSNPRKGFSCENLKKVQDIMREQAGRNFIGGEC